MPRAQANGIELEYEDHAPNPATDRGEALLLIMGLGCQLVHWPDAFVHELTERGFRVIRFDNRDIGLSTFFDDLKPHTFGPKEQARWALGACLPAHYTMGDMADDAVGLLDALGIDRAHVVGASMGGMITQLLEIHHRSRLLSATIIMSTSGKRTVGYPRPSAIKMMNSRPMGDDPETLIEFGIRNWANLQGKHYQADPEEIRPMITKAVSRSIHPAGFLRQVQAVMNQPNRVPMLKKVTTPTLVLHGSDDPLIHVSGGRSIAKAIPYADLVVVEGWGHDLPAALHTEFADRIADLAGTSTKSNNLTGVAA